MRLRASGWVESICVPLNTTGKAGSGRNRNPLGALFFMAESWAPARAPWSWRAASLTCLWLRAGKTVGNATALTSRMMVITTSSSMSVKPSRRAAPLAWLPVPSCLEFFVAGRCFL